MISQGASPLGRLGGSAYSAAPPLGSTTLVTAVANTGGIVIRNIVLAGNGTSQVTLVAGGSSIAVCPASGFFHYLGPGFVIPAGVALTVSIASATGGFCGVTWDVL